jgi:hypothetical protein
MITRKAEAVAEQGDFVRHLLKSVLRRNEFECVGAARQRPPQRDVSRQLLTQFGRHVAQPRKCACEFRFALGVRDPGLARMMPVNSPARTRRDRTNAGKHRAKNDLAVLVL